MVNPTNNIDYTNSIDSAISILSIISDLAVTGVAVVGAVAAIVTATIAYKGLSAWREQLKGKTEYELSRRILRNTYKLKNAVRTVRNPFFYAYEFSESPESEDDFNKRSKYDGFCYVYKTRWKDVEDTRRDLSTDLLDGQVIWGEEIHKLFLEVFKLEDELFKCIQGYLSSLHPRTVVLKRKGEKTNRDIRTYVEEDDDYSKEFNDAIKPIEKFLKPYLDK